MQLKILTGIGLISALINLPSTCKAEISIHEPAIVHIRDAQATLEWTTTPKSFGIIEYGISPALGKISEDDTFALGHTITLKNLKPKTLYFFRINAELWEGKSTKSALYSFTTKEIASELGEMLLKIITPPSVSSLTAQQALITWITNKPSRGIITYGHKQQKKPLAYLSDGDLTLHEASLSHLVPDTLYFFQVTAIDKKGKSVKSSYTSFKTPKATDAQLALPSISEGPSIAFRRSHELKIEWKTDRPCKSIISWGKVPLVSLQKKKEVNESFSTTHVAVLKDLTPNTRYYYVIYLEDELSRKKKSQIFSIRTDQNLGSMGAYIFFPNFI